MHNYKTLSLKVALAGLLFGFDVMVISGVEQSLQNLWNTSDFFHGSVVIAMALWGTLAGAIIGGIPTNKIGRKKTLIGIAFLYLISAVGSALANDPIVFAFFRFIGGVGVGASTIAAPAYIAEITPDQNRGKMVGLYQFSIVLGILLAVASNYLILLFFNHSWRLMIAAEAIPAVLFLFATFSIPESPKWLNEYQNKKALNQSSKNIENSKTVLWSKSNRPLIYLAFWIAFFNQFSGINAVLYYAPRIFTKAGLASESALLSSVGIGIVNLIFTLVGMSLIDHWGRKKLMKWGSFGYIFSLISTAIAFKLQLMPELIVVMIFLFIAAHAIGQGAVIWVFLAEVFPTNIRAWGQSFGSSIHWILAAIIPSLMPYLIEGIGAFWVFMAFGILMCIQLFWVLYWMPETKGKVLI